MDTELARTFLAVLEAGSFVKAAERLHVSQSTVSARIHSLETLLGSTLFVRNKAGTTLTAAGRRFQRHAAILVRTVAHARHEVGVAEGFRAGITVGGRFGLWEDLLVRWLPHMRAAAPDISIRAEIGFESDLMRGLVEGRLDIGLMYTPQARPGMVVEKLLDETLVLVTTRPGEEPIPASDYVYVDWGPEFYAGHAASFPDFATHPITVNIGWLGLRHILDAGGSGYFPARLVAGHLADGSLHRVAAAPTFAVPAYAVFADDARDEPVGLALELIRDIAATTAD